MLVNRSMIQCTVIPELAYPDVIQAATWLCEAFGFSVRVRIGDHRVQLNVGDGGLVITELAWSGKRNAAGLPAEPLPERDAMCCSVMVRVDDLDAHCERARQHGAKILRPPEDFPYGERQATVEDFAGRSWKFSQSIREVKPEEWGGESGESFDPKLSFSGTT
jgi:uncharacterized glyoxalase superfamily protein PhnB